MKTNISKKCTVKLKDGRCFKARIVSKTQGNRMIVNSKEWGEMIVEAREVKN